MTLKTNNNKSKWKAWQIHKQKVIHYFKEGFAAYVQNKYVPLFNFNQDWANLADGQKQLEQSRLNIINPEFFEMKRFAQIYTRNIHLPTTLEINNYVEKKFFDSVLLQGALCVIYSYLPNIEEDIPQNEINYQLIILLNRYLDVYFEKRKKLKIRKQWLKLSQEKRLQLLHELLHVLWLNLKRLHVVKSINKKIIDHRGSEKFMPAIKFHPDFDVTILGVHPFLFNDLPCIQKPKDWVLLENNYVYNGGFHTYSTEFIRKKIYFKGNSIPTKKLVSIINNMQSMEWTVDSIALTDYFLNKEFSSVLTHLETNADKIKRTDDIFQSYNTLLFLKNFCTKYKHFYFVYNIDARGRIYNSADWAFSPNSSKQMRKYIRIPKPLELTEECQNWYYLKIGKLLELPHNSNKQLLTLVKDQFKIYDIETIKNFETYDDFRIYSLMVDIKNKVTDQLLEADCTTSSMQILGTMCNSKKIMELTNLIGENCEDGSATSNYIIKDLYAHIMHKCKEKLPDPIFEKFLNRPLMKSLIMPKAYSKTARTSTLDLNNFIKKDRNFYFQVLDYNDNILQDLYKFLLQTTKDYDLTDSQLDFKTYSNKKIYLFSRCFFEIFNNVYYDEFPEIEILENLFQGKDALLRNFSFTSPFLTFSNRYNKHETYTLENMKDNITYYHSIPYVVNEPNIQKESNAALANAAHFFDGWINHKVLEDLTHKTHIIPVHDSWQMPAKFIPDLQNSTNTAFNLIQEYFSTIPELKIFRQYGNISITSKNIVKIDG